MERENVTLSKKELLRLQVLNQVALGEMTAREAAERLDLSIRQVRRLLAAYRRDGAVALAHGNRGRKPAIAFSNAFRQEVLTKASDPKYAGCNDTHLCELLAEREGLQVSRSTLRRWLRAAGRPSPRKRRPRRYRKLRQRAPRFGALIQIDTSYHDWFEGRGPKAALVAGIDDATGQVVSAHFRPQEDTDGYFVLLADILLVHGIPGAFYHDGRSTFVFLRIPEPSLEEQLEGVLPQTQFGRAAAQLGIAMIHARSPRPREGSSDSGSLCKTACASSSGSPVLTPLRRQTTSCLVFWPDSTSGLLNPRLNQSLLSGLRPRPKRLRASVAVTTDG